MTGWIEFAAAFAAFFLSHSLPLRPFVRTRAESWLGGRGFTLAYSMLSLAVLVWLIVAAGRAPYVELWPRQTWQTHVTLLLMLPVSLILGLSLGRPNPLSFGGRSTGFDPDRPGIVGLLRHPVLAALGLWGIAHMIPNGDLAHVLLFGVFTLFAFTGQWLVDRRKRRDLGPERWQSLVDRVADAKLTLEPMRLLSGVAIYVALIALHPPVIGVSPLPL